MRFNLVDRYLGERLGVDLSTVAKGRVTVAESPRRLHAELSYGYVHALWWLWLSDGRSIISVPPGVGKRCREIVNDAKDGRASVSSDTESQLRAIIRESCKREGLLGVGRTQRGLLFACNGRILRPQPSALCWRLSNDSILAAEGLQLPTHCFPDGIVYGVVVDGRVVSVAYAHRTGTMETEVADIGVETAPAYRRRGYARAAVAALVGHYAQLGGESVYGCSASNLASIATARSVGYVPYASSLVIAAPCSPEGGKGDYRGLQVSLDT